MNINGGVRRGENVDGRCSLSGRNKKLPRYRLYLLFRLPSEPNMIEPTNLSDFRKVCTPISRRMAAHTSAMFARALGPPLRYRFGRINLPLLRSWRIKRRDTGPIIYHDRGNSRRLLQDFIRGCCDLGAGQLWILRRSIAEYREV